MAAGDSGIPVRPRSCCEAGGMLLLLDYFIDIKQKVSADSGSGLLKAKHLNKLLTCLNPKSRRYNNNNNKIWILFAMSAYSFDELKFTSTWEKWKEKENKQKHQKFTMHNPPEQ